MDALSGMEGRKKKFEAPGGGRAEGEDPPRSPPTPLHKPPSTGSPHQDPHQADLHLKGSVVACSTFNLHSPPPNNLLPSINYPSPNK